jgi:hypothetical protein
MSIVLDFPTSPSTNDIYSAPNGTYYSWTGSSWTSLGTRAGNVYDSKIVNITGMANNELARAYNGMPLTITGAAWETYHNLPSYLQGLWATQDINTSDSLSWTIPACKIYLIRDDNEWNAVDTTDGWTLLETSKDYLTGYGAIMSVYEKNFENGTYTFDNNSAMYLFDFSANKIDPSTSFLYRTIYTRGYTSGGYKSGSPWQNCNRTVFATDTTTNLGDLHQHTGSYNTGGHSDTHHYMYNMSNAHSHVSNYVSAVDMQTETGLTLDSAMHMVTSRRDCVALLNSSLTKAYITGGGSTTTDRHDYATGTMMTQIGANPTDNTGASGALTSMFGEFYGWVNVSGLSGRLDWNNETWTSGGWTTAGSTNGQPKGLSSKHGYGYSTIGTYHGTTEMYKYDDTTETTSSVLTMTKPERCGEENMVVGQDWGYSMGSYNGAAQTNNVQKVNYITDSIVAMGSDTQPKGHDGMSSGGCGTGSTLTFNA